MAIAAGQGMFSDLPCAVNSQLKTGADNGESDCLMKTKHCDALNRCWRNVISAQCSEGQRDEF